MFSLLDLEKVLHEQFDDLLTGQDGLLGLKRELTLAGNLIQALKVGVWPRLQDAVPLLLSDQLDSPILRFICPSLTGGTIYSC